MKDVPWANLVFVNSEAEEYARKSMIDLNLMADVDNSHPQRYYHLNVLHLEIAVEDEVEPVNLEILARWRICDPSRWF